MQPTSESISATILAQATLRLKRYNGPRWLWPWSWLSVVASMLGLGAYNLLIYAPQHDRPHAFAVLAFLFAIGLASCVLFSALLIGLRLIALMKVTVAFTRLEIVALATGLGLGTISLGVLALGLLHLYYAATFAVLLIAVPFAFPGERHWLASQISLLVGGIRHTYWKRSNPLDLLGCLILGGVCLSAFALMFVRDLTPPSPVTGYDTYQYHWAIPTLLLRHHGWVAFPGWAHANLPFNTEMLDLVALSLQAYRAATLLQDAFGLLCAMLIFSLVRRAFGIIPALLAVAAQATVPLLIAYSSQSYVETALLCYGGAVLLVLIRWLERISTKRGDSLCLLAFAGALYGFAMGVKYTALEYAPGLILLVLIGVFSFVKHRSTAHSELSTPPSASNNRIVAAILQLTRNFVAFGGAAVATFVPWAIKDWLFLGNPVYPALASIFGAPLWNVTRDQTLESTFHSFGPHNGWVSQLHLNAIDLFLNTSHYGEGASYPIEWIMPAASLLLPVCLVILYARRHAANSDRTRLQILVIGALAATAITGFIIWTFSGALVERYAIPMVALITVVGSIVAGWLITVIPRRMWLVSLVLLLLVTSRLFLQEKVYLYHDEQVARSPIPLVTGQISEDRYMRTRNAGGMPADFWRMSDYVNQTLPHDGKLLMLGRGTGYFFQDREYVADSGGDWVPYLVSEGKTSDGILHILRSQGFTYIVYDANLMYWLTHTYHNDLLQADLPTYLDFQQHQLILIKQWGSISLYRLPVSA